MRTRLFIILFLCLPLCVLADNGYDDIGDFFKYCSTAKSPGLRHTYVSKLMMKRVSSLPAGEFDLKPIYDKIDFIQSVYVMPRITVNIDNSPLVWYSKRKPPKGN